MVIICVLVLSEKMALEKRLSEEEIKEIYAEEESYKFFVVGKISKLIESVLQNEYMTFRKVQKKTFWALLDMLSLGIDE